MEMRILYSLFAKILVYEKGIELTLLETRVDITDGKNQTALHIATKHNKTRCSEILLQFKARVDLQDSEVLSFDLFMF